MPRARPALILLLTTLVLAACAGARQPADQQGRAEVEQPADVPGTDAAATSAPRRRALRFAVIGDFGSGEEPQMEVAARMCRWRERHPYDLVVTTGDNVYETGHPDDFPAKFFEPYACLFEEGVRFRAALGNHDIQTDGGQPMLDEPRFGMKGRNYVVRKRGVRFVIVDSNDLKRRWMWRNLRRERGDRWVVAVLHHPVFSGGSDHGSSSWLSDLSRMFARRGVNLVLHGHDHVYSVSKKMRGDVRYVVTGGGGASLDDCVPRTYIAWCEDEYHFLYIKAGRKRLVSRAVPISGEPLHRVRIER